MLFEPCFEITIFIEDAVQRVNDNVGRVCFKEFGIALQVSLELRRHAELQGFIFGLFRRCFQDGHDLFPLVNGFALRSALQSCCFRFYGAVTKGIPRVVRLRLRAEKQTCFS